jgi:hypothetical protein
LPRWPMMSGRATARSFNAGKLVSIGVAIVVIPRAELRHYPASAAGFKEKWDDGEPARKSRNAEYNLRCRMFFVAGASNLPAWRAEGN